MFIRRIFKVPLFLIITAFLFTSAMTVSFAADISEADLVNTRYMYASDMNSYTPDQYIIGPTFVDGSVIWDYFPADTSSGSGVFNVYLRLQTNNLVEYGLNHDGKTEYLEKDNWTSILLLENVPIVEVEGTFYREFAIDINEPSSNLEVGLLSLEAFQVWQTQDANLNGDYDIDNHILDGEGSDILVYDLDDQGVNRTLVMDYLVNSGSGKPDYKVLIPYDLFDNEVAYVSMFAHHGELYGNDSGFEEWGVRVPEFGYFSGNKFHDANANGIWDTEEPGLEGWTIYVDYNDNNVLDGEEPYAESNEDGKYTIMQIDPGTWKVKEVGQSSWTQSYPVTGSHEVIFTPGVEETGDFGNYMKGSISGVKFHDANADGLKTGDVLLSNWEIYIDENNDNTFDIGERKEITDSNGAYTFSGLNPGTYTIREILKSGWTQSYPGATIFEHVVTITSSGSEPDEVVDKDFGNYMKGSISGVKFHDANADGSKVGDVLLPDWKIYIDENGNDSFDSGEPIKTTNSIGTYTFSGLNPGTYTIREILKSGWTQSYPGATTFEHVVTITSSGSAADEVVDKDFGNYMKGSISGVKFHDANADGSKAGDVLLSNWEIYIDENDNDSFDSGEPTQTTDTNGAYTFSGLIPGTYTIREVLQSGWTQSYPAITFEHVVTITSSGSAADEVVDKDFGNYMKGSISGVKFHDANADGSKSGDVLLSNWEIYIDENGNDSFDSGEPTQTTDTNGAYTFSGLIPGTYTIREVLQGGWTQSYPAISFEHVVTITSSGSVADEVVDKDFGNYMTGSISGVKFHDANADGSKVGDVLLSNWEIYIDENGNDSFDSGEPTQTTDTNGAYTFSGLIPGTYTIREVLQSGWVQSYPAISFEHVVTITSSGSVADDEVDKDFGNYMTGSISGVKFYDANADGNKVGDVLLSDWEIYIDENDNDTFDIGEPTQTTDTNGAYTFNGLIPGTYTIREVLQSGWTQSYPAISFEHVVIITSSGSAADDEVDKDFGNYMKGSISGVKFHDANADGSKAGDVLLSDCEIYIDVNNDNTLDNGEPTQTTDTNGAYTFSGLNPGTYTIREVLQSGWTQSYPAITFEHVVTITSSGSAADDEVDKDFGNYMKGSISGVKFHDANADGSKAGDVLLSDWEIYIDVNNDNTLDNGEPTQTTDTNGAYTFSGLNPGTYTIREVLQSGWTQSYPAITFEHVVTITSSGSAADDEVDKDFGNYMTGSISGVKFYDANVDGNKAGDVLLPDWEIYIDENGNDSFDSGEPTQTTDTNGAYTFSGLIPGTYAIREVLQSGWTQSYPGATTFEHVVTITSSGSAADDEVDKDFGNYMTGSISGVKFHDANADGNKAGDVLLSDWEIYIDENGNDSFDSGEPTQTTDTNGAYTFSGLIPGTYTIREVLQSGWTQSYPAITFEHVVTITSSGSSVDDVVDKDFGNYMKGSISGVKFHDANEDGSKVGEVLLPGWEIYIDENGNDSFDSGEPTETTDTNGAYTFSGLNPGTYTIREVLQSGWIQSYPAITFEHVVLITSSGLVADYEVDKDFGNYQPVIYQDETAWGYFREASGEMIYPTVPQLPFTDISERKFGNWGWTNGGFTNVNSGDVIILDLYAGIGDNDPSDDTPVGFVTVEFENGYVMVTYNITSYEMSQIHFYIGNDKLPIVKKKLTNSPGQFPYSYSENGMTIYTLSPIDFDYSEEFYIAAHTVVQLPIE